MLIVLGFVVEPTEKLVAIFEAGVEGFVGGY